MKALMVIRDLIVMVGIIVLCGVAAFDVSDHMRSRAEQETRLALMRNAVNKLDETYKSAVFNQSDNKGIYQQMFRQTEILIEYQKLLLMAPYLPAASSETPPVPVSSTK